MKITSINIPEDRIDNGLKAINMQRLGQIVLVAGKNGSGKSRLLTLIQDAIKSKPKKLQIDNASTLINRYERYMQNHESKIKNLQEQKASLINSPNDLISIENNIEAFQFNIIGFKKNIDYLNAKPWNLIETDELADFYPVVPFLPKSLNIKSSNAFNPDQLQSLTDNNNSFEFSSFTMEEFANETFAKIQKIQNKWINSTHPDLNVPIAEKEKAISDYQRLQGLIKLFLKTENEAELGRTQDGEPTLFNLPLSKAYLSDGQKILIQFCIAIYEQQKTLNELILLLDEPENYLHPSVIIEIINKIIEHNPKGQIWIATHSVPLLSYFDPSNIWFIKDNKVSYAGTIPEEVLKSLLGDDERIAKLQDFTNLPGILALNRHAFESLFHPEAVTTGKKDPQTLQINEEFKSRFLNKRKIRVLDYGAGKGRILAHILENNLTLINEVADTIDYIAYDKYSTDREVCISLLKSVYGDWEQRYFNNLSDLCSIYDKESFDVVLMCNVLHEIDPNDWLTLFSKTGPIPELLNSAGILLVVEDQEMPIGEKAYQKGFIVLNTQEIKTLFKIKEKESGFGFSDARGDGRLLAHRIPKEFLTRITSKTRLQALKTLNKKATIKIKEIREKEISYRNGKIHGFWLQQLANTTLSLNELTNN